MAESKYAAKQKARQQHFLDHLAAGGNEDDYVPLQTISATFHAADVGANRQGFVLPDSEAPRYDMTQRPLRDAYGKVLVDERQTDKRERLPYKALGDSPAVITQAFYGGAKAPLRNITFPAIKESLQAKPCFLIAEFSGHNGHAIVSKLTRFVGYGDDAKAFAGQIDTLDLSGDGIKEADIIRSLCEWSQAHKPHTVTFHKYSLFPEAKLVTANTFKRLQSSTRPSQGQVNAALAP